ncbi:hypothetical protein IFM89_004753 [Coptis chinensis]|uniref:Peptidase A1 domain-containing protein n=1 Tax=Coptis chinensis TaxID=261450 RepID=A0A835LPK2_9MAGN|nr:hypothetical protein IFM89_004753 [Coptis chinensis]
MGQQTKPLNHTEILIQDQGRIHSIQSRIPKGGVHSIDSMAATLPVNSGNSLGTGNFIVTIGFGTPKRDLPIIFDTGSDLTWIQCQPCVGGCYSQLDPIFDPSYSSSYTNISCTSIDCAQVQSGTSNIPGCSSSTCVYGITYGDQSYSYGFFAEETLTVTPSDVFPKFQFGCGEQNNGLFGEAAGLLGLGRDNISFVSQTSQKYNKSFSYCIPSGSSSGFLAFGAPNSTASSSTLSNSTAAKFTPLLTDSRGPSFYFLDLQGISVGATKLAISPSTFNLSGTIIDSGTVITRLPPLAYSALRTAFQQAMASYPAAPAMSILDTCYDFSGFQTVNVPKIVLHFANETDLDVDFSGIFYASNVYQVCLAFAGNTDAKETAGICTAYQELSG